MFKPKSKQKKESRFKVPRTVQDTVPVKEIYKDGIFLLKTGEFSKTWRFSDINYLVSNDQDKLNIISNYMNLINSLEATGLAKVTINNKKLNQKQFYDEVLIKTSGDDLDLYREEYNQMLADKVNSSNAIKQEKYITLTYKAKTLELARSYFNRKDIELNSYFNQLGSSIEALDSNERVRILHDFYRTGEESSYFFDWEDTLNKGHSFKDYIVPDKIEFLSDYFKYGDRYGRVIFLRDYANFLSDEMISELTEFNRDLILNIDIQPIPTDEAIRKAENTMLSVEANITAWQDKQNQTGNFSAEPPYRLRMQREAMEKVLEDLTTRDQKMIIANLTMIISAKTKEALDEDTETILSTALKNVCQMGVLHYQQLEGLTSTLPFGVTNLKTQRTLNTESVAGLMPFRVQEILQPTGVYYGQNAISKNLIIADKSQLQNGNCFILGVSGSGKSFSAKQEIVHQILATDSDVIIIDPEREYSPLVKELGGEVIKISSSTKNYINAMDINDNYAEDSVRGKSDFIISLMDILVGSRGLSSGDKSIIDRCVHYVYQKYNWENLTLKDLYDALISQPEKESRDLALSLELFTTGSLDIFAKPTNVDINNRFVCFDILDLGTNLQTIGMLVVLDQILNRITKNRQEKRNTYVFIDEIYLLFKNEYCAEFLEKLWKRVRKYGAFTTGITQNVEDLLESNTARKMLSNSEFLTLLNQSPLDAKNLADLLEISEEQLSYITNAKTGAGLMKIGKNLIPFENTYPKNNLYQLMTTKLSETK